MDEELKALLDEARGKGANLAQLQGIVDAYKKKNLSGTSSSEPDTFFKPAPSSSAADAGTSTLEQGKATLDSIQDGTIRQDAPAAQQQPSPESESVVASVGNGLEPTKEASDAALKETTENNLGESSLAIMGSINTGLAKITDLPAGLGKLENSITDLVSPKIKDYNFTNTGKLWQWASDYLRKTGTDNPLPNTIGGKIVGGVAQTVPMILGTVVTGGATAEGEIANEATELGGSYLTKSNILQNALTKASGPLTQYLTATGAGTGLNEGYDESGGKIIPTLLGGLKGGQEGLESGIMLEGQMAAGEQLGGNLFKLALKTGVVNEDGILTQQALKSLVASPTVFAASSVAEDLANNRPVDWTNAGVSGATALPFEAQHVIEAAGEQGDLNERKAKLNTAIQNATDIASNNAIINFSTALPDDIHAAMNRSEGSQELQVLALAKGVEAQNAATYQEKNQLHLEQLKLQQQADIKSIGDVVMQHGAKGFLEALNQTELPDETKQTAFNNTVAVQAGFNPIVKERVETEQHIEDLTNTINTIQAKSDGANPITNPEGTAALIDAVEKRTDLQVEQLDKTIDNPEHKLTGEPQVLFHGSADDFENFEPEKLGLFTNSESAKKGFFFTNSEDVANSYKEAGVKNRPNIDGLKEHLESLGTNELKSLYDSVLGKYTGNVFDYEDPRNSIDELIDAAKEDHGAHILDKKFVTEQIFKHVSNNNRDYKAYETEGKLHKVNLDVKNPLIVDGKGTDVGDVDINKIIDEAKEKGHDGVIVKNVFDEALLHEKGAQHEASDIHVVFDKSQIRRANEQRTIQAENEAPADNEPPAESRMAEANVGIKGNDGNEPAEELATPTGQPFPYRSKAYGDVTIQPLSDGEFNVRVLSDGVTLKLDKDFLAHKDGFNFDVNKLQAPEHEQKLHSTDNEHEIARMYDDKVKELQEPSNSKDHAIANYNPTTTREQFAQTDDVNHLKGAPTIALNYFRNDGLVNNLDTQADEINHNTFNGKEVVKPEDITDFMKRYPNGTRTFFSPNGNPELKAIGERYTEITTKDINSKLANKLSKEFPSVTKGEIAGLQNQFESIHNDNIIKRFIDEQLNKPGLSDVDEVIADIQTQFERYQADPKNEFNIFHDVYKGDELSPEEIEDIKNEIQATKDEQSGRAENGEEPADTAGGETPGQEETGGNEPEPVTAEDDIPFQRGTSDAMPPERAKVTQDLLEKVFPNVETIFHPTIEDFAKAAKANDIDATDLPNAFVDKNGKINFNPEALNKDTQIHEYGHILTQWAKENAPGLYKRMMAFGRDATDIHRQLEGNGYHLTPSRMADEAFVTILGREGEGKLDQVIKNSGTRGTISKFINEAWTKFQRYILEKTGFDISKFQRIKNMNINDFLDTINSKYLLSETKIGDIGTRQLNKVSEQRTKPVQTPGESLSDYIMRVSDWTKEIRNGQKAIDFQEEQRKQQEKAKGEQEERGYDPEMIEANNAYMDAKVKNKFGIEALDHIMAKMQDTDLKAIVEKVKVKMKWDDKYLEDTRNRVLRNQSGTATDQAALLMDQYALKAQEESLIKDINKETDPEEVKKLQKKLFDNQNATLDNAMANRLAGRDSSTLFRLRQVAINGDANLDYMREKYMASEGTKELTPEQEEFVRDQYQKIRDAEIEVKNIKEKESQTRAENERLKKENEALHKIIDTARKNYETKKTSTGDRLTQIRKDIDGSKQRLKELVFGHTNSLGILHPEIYKELKNIGFKKAEEIYLKTKGSIDLDGYVKRVMDEIKEIAPKITERDVRDALTDNYERGKPKLKLELTKNIEELKRQAKILNNYQDFISGEDYSKGINKNDTEEVGQLTAERERSDLDGKEWNIQRYKEIQRQIKDYQDKLTRGDFTTPAKEATKFEKSERLKEAEHELAIKKFLWDKKVKEGLLKQRPTYKKWIDNILAWQRFAVLSYTKTLGKLIATVAHGLIIKPFQLAHQELSYQILHKIGQATGRTGVSGDINGKVHIESLAKYYSAFVRNFSIENLTNAFKGIDKADIMYGASKHMDYDDMGSGWYDTILAAPGRSHGYIKSFLKAPETAFAHEQLMQSYYEKSNNIQKQLNDQSLSDEDRSDLEKEYAKYDLTDQENLERINALAAAQGSWGILMNKNVFVEKFRGWMSRNGILGDAIKSEIPILKIPVNYVNRYFLMKLGWIQAFTGKYNLITGELETPGLIHIAIKGTDGMTDSQKEILSRTIAYGSMGATLAVAGFLLRKNIKQNSDGSAEIDGVHIPAILLHAPATDIFLSGVNMGNHIDKLKGEEGADDYLKAYVESDIDVIEKMPFTNQLEYGFFVKVAQAIYLKSDKSTEKKVYSAFDKKVSYQFTPGFIKEWAEAQDENTKGEVIKRAPKNLLENIEVGIPGLRTNVKKK